MVTRRRRKCVRWEGGSACQRRIMSRNASSASRLTAASRARRPGRFFKGFLQYFEDGEIARAPRGLLALDDVGERRHPQLVPANLNDCGTVAHTLKRADAMDRAHEIDLQAIVV